MIPIGPTLQQFGRRGGARLARALGKQVPSHRGGRRDRARHARAREDPRPPDAHGAQRRRPRDRAAGGAASPRARTPSGTIALRALHAAAIVIELSDDGAGIDRARILEGPASRASAARTRPTMRRPLVFAPGVSTARRSPSSRAAASAWTSSAATSRRSAADRRSKRGGGGHDVPLRLPLTLALIDGFVVRAAGETYVLPMDPSSSASTSRPRRADDGLGAS